MFNLPHPSLIVLNSPNGEYIVTELTDDFPGEDVIKVLSTLTTYSEVKNFQKYSHFRLGKVEDILKRRIFPNQKSFMKNPDVFPFTAYTLDQLDQFIEDFPGYKKMYQYYYDKGAWFSYDL